MIELFQTPGRPDVVSVRASGEDKGRLDAWREGNAIEVEGARHTAAFKRKQWDGKYKPGDWLRVYPDYELMRIGRGLVRRLLTDLQEGHGLSQVKFAFQDRAALPQVWRLYDLPDPLRDYQLAALDEIGTRGWCRVAFATNAGKGAVIALAGDDAAQMGKQVLVLCDERSVFEALVEQIEKWTGRSPYQVKAGVKDLPTEDDKVVVAMVQTLAKRALPAKVKKGGKKRKPPTQKHTAWQTWLAGVEMLLVDEADKATSDQWQEILEFCYMTEWRVGFSGTFPEERTTKEDWVLESCIGPICQRVVDNMELVDREISAKPQIVLVPFDGHYIPKLTKKEREDMTGAEQRLHTYDHAIVYNEDRHRFIASLLLPDEPNAIIVNRVEHGRQLSEIIPDSVFLDGSTTQSKRDEVLDQFARGEFQNLIATKILDRGSNRLGTAVGLIFAAAEGSSRQVLQRVGRGLRRAGGKEFIVVKDILDTGNRYLKNASRKRLRVYQKERFEIRLHKFGGADVEA